MNISDQISSLSIAQAPIGSIRRYGNNARIHGKREIEMLKTSMRENGFTAPILVDESMEIIAGHGRLTAATELGLEMVPVIRIDHLTSEKKKALRILDNKLVIEGAWSPDLLAEELASLAQEDFDLSLTGFEDIEIEKILTPDLGPPEDEEIASPPVQPVSRPGDLFQVGNHFIFCGDALDPASYDAVLGERRADMVFSDFPYNVPIKGHVNGKGKVTHDEFQMASGEMSAEMFGRFLDRATSHCQAYSRDGSLHYLCCDWRMVRALIEAGEANIGTLFNLVVWAKANGGMGSFYRSQHEMIAIFKNGTAPHVNNIQLGRMGRNRTNVWHYPGATGFSKTRSRDLADHPTVKPVALVADAIRDATNPDDLVLDPFGGAGTTMLAAEHVGRRSALIEIEPKFVDVTLRRFEERFGIEAELMPDKIPFSHLKETRHGE